MMIKLFYLVNFFDTSFIACLVIQMLTLFLLFKGLNYDIYY